MKDTGDGMRQALRGFVADHREGWSHGHWESLLHQLKRGGFDTARPDDIGLELERERVRVILEDAGIRGLGPKRREAVVEEFETLWDLKHASVDDLTRRSEIPRSLAEQLHAALS